MHMPPSHGMNGHQSGRIFCIGCYLGILGVCIVLLYFISPFQCICWELYILCYTVFVCMLMSWFAFARSEQRNYLLTYILLTISWSRCSYLTEVTLPFNGGVSTGHWEVSLDPGTSLWSHLSKVHKFLTGSAGNTCNIIQKHIEKHYGVMSTLTVDYFHLR